MFIIFFLHNTFKIKSLRKLNFCKNLRTQVTLLHGKRGLFFRNPIFQHNIDYKTEIFSKLSDLNVILKTIVDAVKGVIL